MIWLAALLLVPGALQAGQFQFGTMVRAGVSGAGDWELAAGKSSGDLPPSASTRDLGADHFINGEDNPFSISYQKSSNTATLTVQTKKANGGGTVNYAVSYHPVGGNLLGATAMWRIPIGSLYASATQIPTASSIKVSNLRLSGAISILSPIRQATIFASQSNTPGGAVVRQSADIMFASHGSGDWKLEGEIKMTGLPVSGSSAGARRSQLQFGLTVFASDVPEPGTLAVTGLALGMLGWIRGRGGRLRRFPMGNKKLGDDQLRV